MFNLGQFNLLPFNRYDSPDGKVSMTYVLDLAGKKNLYRGQIEDGILTLYSSRILIDNKNKWSNLGVLSSDALRCSVVFDGTFTNTDSSWKITYDLDPYIFFIDSSGLLKYCRGSNPDEKITLVTNTVNVASLRYWPDPEGLSDPGLLLAYIKTDGETYCKTYAQDEYGTKVWGSEISIVDAPDFSDHLILFRTNLYN